MNLGETVTPVIPGEDLRSSTLNIDLPRLLETRMLVQANSGGGKSFALRRLLEQTAPNVQQLVIDPEGEFSTLREKFDFIIAAPHDGDAVASPQTAALLARRLLETGVSAILDIYDLKAHDRQLFVKRFLEALVNAPRKLWHPVLLVIDEAHVFCPQSGGAEAMGAVIDVCTRGRKRGLCPVLATQRLSKLHKDAAAEMLNKLVGRTGLDVDVKRAADELGMNAREATEALRNLQPGEFYCFGPALTPIVTRISVGDVQTTHPQSGHRLMTAPPAPSARVRESLAKLAGLQQEAEQEVADIEGLRRQVASLQRDLRAAARPVARTTLATANTDVAVVNEDRPRFHAAVALARQIVALSNDAAPVLDAATCVVSPSGRPAPRAPQTSDATLRAGAIRILQELSARMPAGYTRPQVGALTGFTASGGTFGTYFSNLKKTGFIEERGGLVYATEAGIQHLGADVPRAPTSHADAMALWKRALRKGAFEMLQAIVAAARGGLSRADLAAAVGMTASGGTFGTYLSNLRRNGLITESGGALVANDILFPENSNG